MKSHRDLLVWQNAVNFVTDLYRVTKSFPKEEVYGLTSQLRRTAISIPSNIAEGAARKGKQEFRQFLYVALASGAEIETQLIIAKNLGYLDESNFEDLSEKLSSIQRMTQGLIKSII